jgi:hypothetical protein
MLGPAEVEEIIEAMRADSAAREPADRPSLRFPMPMRAPLAMVGAVARNFAPLMRRQP